MKTETEARLLREATDHMSYSPTLSDKERKIAWGVSMAMDWMLDETPGRHRLLDEMIQAWRRATCVKP